MPSGSELALATLDKEETEMGKGAGGLHARCPSRTKKERRISIGGPDRGSRMQSLEGSKAPSVGGQRRWFEDGAEN